MSNSTSWFSWWFNTQPTAADTTGVADPTASRVYIAELKTKLNNQLRAERAECCLDFCNPTHMRIFSNSISEVSRNLMRASIESINAEIADDSFQIMDLRKILAIREKRRIEDLEQRINLQTDYMNYQRSLN